MRFDWKRVSPESIQHIGRTPPTECHTDCNIANELIDRC
jgi:hypothetical protein